MAAAGLSPLKHLRLALRQLSSRTHAPLGAAAEEGTERRASWNPGEETVRWPKGPRNQRQQVCFSAADHSLATRALTTSSIGTVSFHARNGNSARCWRTVRFKTKIPISPIHSHCFGNVMRLVIDVSGVQDRPTFSSEGRGVVEI